MSRSVRNPRPRLASRWLRTAHLNFWGWAALIVATALVADVFAISHLPIWLGIVLVQGGLVAADRAKWARMSSSISWTENLDEVVATQGRLRMLGATTSVDGNHLTYRNRDWRKVRAVLPSVTIRP